MTLKQRMKQYNFWISLVSACLLVARIIGSKFNYEIDSSLVMDITTALCGVFVILGIISSPVKVIQNDLEKTAKNKEDKVLAEAAMAEIVKTEEVSNDEAKEANEPNQDDVIIETYSEENLKVEDEETKIQEPIFEIEPNDEEITKPEPEIIQNNEVKEEKVNQVDLTIENLQEMDKNNLINIILASKNN